MKEYNKGNGTTITIDDNGIARVSNSKINGTLCQGVRYWEELPQRLPITVAGMSQPVMLALDYGLSRWLDANWPIKEMPKTEPQGKSWDDCKPAGVAEMEEYERVWDAYRYKCSKRFDSEATSFLTYAEPTIAKPVLSDEAKAYMHIDSLCDASGQIRYSAAIKARDAVISGKMTLVEASQYADKLIADAVKDYQD